jgi:hypothetical protein
MKKIVINCIIWFFLKTKSRESHDGGNYARISASKKLFFNTKLTATFDASKLIEEKKLYCFYLFFFFF